MNELILNLSPFLIIAVATVISMGYKANLALNRQIGFYSIFLALCANTFLMVYQTSTLIDSDLFITLSGLMINEILLILNALIFVSVETNLHKSHTPELITSTYLLFVLGSLGTTMTTNLLIITLFYMLTAISVISLFFFGPYRKKFNILNRFLIISIILFGILLVINFCLYYYYHTLDLGQIQKIYASGTLGLQYFLFIGAILGFSGLCGILPIFLFHLKDYFTESNPVNLRVMTLLFYPLSAITTLRVLNAFDLSMVIHGQILFVFGLVGVLVSIVLLFIELFGKFREQTRSIPKIIGTLSIMEYNVILLMASIISFGFFTNAIVVFVMIFFFIALSVSVKFIFIEGLAPIFDSTQSWDLNALGGYAKHFSQYLWVLFTIPFLYAVPGLIGYLFIMNSVPALSVEMISQPFFTAQLWTILGIVIAVEIILLITIATIITEVFFGKSKSAEREIVPKMKPIFYYSPIIMLCIIIGLCVFINTFPLLFNNMITQLYTQFFNFGP